MAKIGVFGGSFNPVHVGHLLLAEWVRIERGLHTVLFVPAGKPPHKPGEPLAPAEDRLRMTELAVRGNPAFELRRLELDRGGPSYTLLTLRELGGQLESGDRLYLLLGADSLLDLPEWWHADELAHEVPIIVFGRPGHPLEGSWEELAQRFGDEWVDRVQRLRVRAPLIELSASGVRDRVRAGLSVRYMVPEPVRRYIREKRLYAGT